MNDIRCHDSEPRFGGRPIVWKTSMLRGTVPEGTTCDGPDAPQPFRSCSYCGSMHPLDLVAALEAGASLGGSDWKYGWPHKFYVSGIPNPNPSVLVFLSARYGGLDENGEPRRGPYDVKWREAGPLLNAKFYNQHLSDLDADSFARVSKLLLERGGIEFSMVEGRLRFRAPHHGYQR